MEARWKGKETAKETSLGKRCVRQKSDGIKGNDNSGNNGFRDGRSRNK